MGEFKSCDLNIPTLQAVATVGWMAGSIIWVSIFPLIIGRMGNINSSSSRFSVFIFPDQHYHQGKDPNVNVRSIFFSRWIFRWFHQTFRFHSGCSPLVIEDGISQCCKNGLTDGQLRCCIPTVLLAKEIYRHQMWGRSVVGTFKIQIWCICNIWCNNLVVFRIWI